MYTHGCESRVVQYENGNTVISIMIQRQHDISVNVYSIPSIKALMSDTNAMIAITTASDEDYLIKYKI